MLCQVVAQRGRVRGAVGAKGASKRLLPGVYPHVLLNGTLCGGAIVTLIAAERLLACVGAYVDTQVIFPSGGIGTKITVVHPAAGRSPTIPGTTFLPLYL